MNLRTWVLQFNIADPIETEMTILLWILNNTEIKSSIRGNGHGQKFFDVIMSGKQGFSLATIRAQERTRFRKRVIVDDVYFLRWLTNNNELREGEIRLSGQDYERIVKNLS